jgi:hypothetical protein
MIMPRSFVARVSSMRRPRTFLPTTCLSLSSYHLPEPLFLSPALRRSDRLRDGRSHYLIPANICRLQNAQWFPHVLRRITRQCTNLDKCLSGVSKSDGMKACEILVRPNNTDSVVAINPSFFRVELASVNRGWGPWPRF